MPPSPLPVESCRDAVDAAMRGQGTAVVCAPPGSGKSTLIPQFLLDSLPAEDGSIVVLQPRRVAARSLAAFVARMRGEAPGETVGYQVRFESRTSAGTRIIYQTYGVFLRKLLADPRASGIAAVVLDEFHERTLEVDTALAWLRHLRQHAANSPRLIVMSATMDAGEVCAYLGESTPRIEVAMRAHPVAVTRRAAPATVPLDRQACAALEGLVDAGLDGSVLIFMPGMREIRRTLDALQDLCHRRSLRLFALHGSLDLDEQMRVMDAAARGDCVIVSTNVAETSLTIPGVTAVIDAGWERVAGYDPVRERNTLYLSPISQFSAAQRAGRAGRTAPGRCIRLWDDAFESRMPPSLTPEITRLELSQTFLTASGMLRKAGLPAAGPFLLPWISTPDEHRWQGAVALLRDIEAIDAQPAMTSLGESLLRWPVDPLAARILHDAQEQGIALLTCAAIALWEAEDEETGDLFEAATQLVSAPARTDRFSESGRSFSQMVSLCDATAISRERSAMAGGQPADGDLRRRMAECWMRVLHRRIAVREETGSRFVFADRKTATLSASRAPERRGDPQPAAVLALSLRESGGAGRARRNDILAFLPLEAAWIAEAFPAECRQTRECRWDEQRRAVVGETRTEFRGLALERTIAPGASVDPEATASLLAAQLVKDPSAVIDDSVSALIARVRCTASSLPHYEFPRLGDDDWDLIYHDLCLGKSALGEVSARDLAAAIRDYLGETRWQALERCAPLRVQLPNGRSGKVRYAHDAPPALSARIGDLIGVKGKFRICEGRVEGIYDILAPNMRTVQKTADIDGFWTSTYPQIKRELQRRYPRHPWP